MDLREVRLDVDELLALRPWQPADAEPLHELVDENFEHLRRWLSWVEQDHSVEGKARFIERCRQSYASGTSLELALTDDREIIGACGYVALNSDDRWGELGYWIAERFQGRGYITSACRTLIDYGFAELGLHRQLLRAAADNSRSRAIAERLRFTFEGLERGAQLLNGHYEDLSRYSVLEDEWFGAAAG